MNRKEIKTRPPVRSWIHVLLGYHVSFICVFHSFTFRTCYLHLAPTIPFVRLLCSPSTSRKRTSIATLLRRSSFSFYSIHRCNQLFTLRLIMTTEHTSMADRNMGNPRPNMANTVKSAANFFLALRLSQRQARNLVCAALNWETVSSTNMHKTFHSAALTFKIWRLLGSSGVQLDSKKHAKKHSTFCQNWPKCF